MKKPVLESLFNKVTGLKVRDFIKRDPDTGVFLFILKKFYKHLFYRTPPKVASYN